MSRFKLFRHVTILSALICFVVNGWGQVSLTATIGTVGPTSYTTLSAAFGAINSGTHKGVITINITGNTSEPAAPTALLTSSGTSSYSAITIKPSGGNFTISGAATPTASRAIIELNGADNVTIDGDDPSVSGTRNLTISFPSTSATIAACIRVSSNSTTGTDGANNNIIKNCIITGNRVSLGTTATYGINLSNYSSTSLATGGYSSINNRFENNLITRCYFGIWAVGSSATYPNSGLQIVNNVLGDNTATGNIGNRGIILSYTATTESQAAIVSGNEIAGVGDPGTTGYAASIAGMEFGTVYFGTKVFNNYIHDVKQPSTSGYGAYGVLFAGSTSCDSIRFYNNIITRITASNYTTTSLSLYTNYGVKMTAGTTFGDFSNNTIVLSTANPTGTTTNPISYAFSCDVNGVRIVNFRNNIIVNSISSTNAIGVYTNNAAIFTNNVNWNKNCYWVPSGILGYYAATAYTTFSAWKTASGKDAFSYNLNPSFVSATDLHINGSSATLLESGGMATSFNTDFDGQTRPGPAASVNGGAISFDVGADEFDGVPLMCTTPTSIAASVTSTAQTFTSISGSFTAASIVPTGYLVVRKTTNVQPTLVTGTSYSLGSNAIGFIEYVGTSVGSWTSSNLSNGTTYYYWVFSYNNTPGSCLGPVYSSSAATLTQSTLACSGSALASLSYSTSTASYCTGNAITTNTATLGTTSGIPAYSISPALPTGLALSSSSGNITGTPTTAQSSTSYTITADNGCTNTTATISIEIVTSPTAPSSSAASLVSYFGFTANWTTNGATSYLLDVATDASFTNFVSGYSSLNVGNVTTYSISGLNAGILYYYRVRAVSGSCISANSTSQSATTISISSIATGNWNATTTWNSGTVPTCGDIVTIASPNTVSVNSTSNVSKNLTIATGGTLTIASGDLTVGCTLNNTPLTNNGTLTVTGGTLNVNGNVVCASTFNQSGGEINIDGNANGVAANSVLTGTNLLRINTNLLNLTGGRITIVDPHAGSSTSDYSIGYNTSSLNYACGSGHTTRFGNGVSTDAGGHTNGFYNYLWVGTGYLSLGNVEVDVLTGTNRFVKTTSTIGIMGNLTITSGDYQLASTTYVAGNITNNGYLTATSTLNLGSWTNATGSATSNTQTIAGSGTFRNATTSSTASLSSLTVNNTSSAGVTILTPLSISGTLTMTAGNIITTATNLLTLGTTTAAGTLTYTAGQIAGPFARTFASSRTATGTYDVSTLYPVGDGTNYLPIYIDPTTSASGATVMRGQVFNTNSGTAGTGVATTLSSKRWEAIATIGSSNLTNSFIQLNDAGIASGNIIAQSTSSSGTYNAILPTSTFTSGTPNTLKTATSIAAANYSGYFTYAAPGPAITSFTPTSACPNAARTITITGTNLGSATSATLNGEACTIVSNSSTQLVITTDATPQAGNIVVTTAANSATSATALSLFSIPTVTATSDASNNTICSGSNITLNGGGASTYTWNNSAINNVAFAPSSSTTYTVTGTDGNGCTNTASIAVTVNQIVAIVTHPSNQVVLPNDNAVFSVSATGTGLAYQWQENTGSGWNAITNGGIYSGATTNTLTLTGVTSANTGNQYQCIVSGTAPCSAQTSNTATLTISSTAISVQPVNQTICVTSGTASFSITTTGTIPTYQWQVSINSGSSWADIPNENAATLTLSGLLVSNSNNLYRCSLNSGSINSNSALLTVNSASMAGSVSADQGICSNASAANITLFGNSGNIQWQVSSDNNSFANIANATASPLTAAQIGSLSATRYYRAVVTNGVCSAANSAAVTITVTTAPNAGTLSGTQAVCIGATTSFSSNGDAGGAWTSSNASNATINSSGTVTGVAAGSATMTYTVTGIGGCTNATATRTVTINANPTISTATASPASACAGSSVSLGATSMSTSAGVINSGSGSTASTTYHNPFYGLYSNIHTQHIILASELTANGMVAGNITSFALTFTSANTAALLDLSIKIGLTTSTSASSYISGTLSQVYSSASFQSTVGTVSFPFSSAFNWDGTSNIVVDFCYGNVSTTVTNVSTISMDATSYVSSNYYRSTTAISGATACSSTTLTGSYSARPQFKFSGQMATNVAANFSWSWNTNPTVATATGTTTAVNNTSSAINQTYTVTATNATTGCTNTATTSAITINPVPSAPTATNSSQCGVGVPTGTIASNSGATSPNLNWYTAATNGSLVLSSATGSLVNYYSNDFSSNVGTGVITGNASLTGGVLQLTPNLGTQLGALTIPASGNSADKYKVSFNVITSAVAQTGADGLSYSFGDDVSGTSTTVSAETGSGSKLKVSFDAYGTSGAGISGIRLIYGSTISDPGNTVGTNGILAYSTSTAFAGGNVPVIIETNSQGQLTLTVNGTAIFTNVQLPTGYLSADKSNWMHGFKARTGGVFMTQSIDDLVIQQSSNAPATSFPNSISSTITYYVTETVNGCGSTTPITFTVNTPPAINTSASSTTICAGGSTTLSASSANTGYTYTWNNSAGSGSSVSVSPSTTTTYTVTGTDASGGASNGCSATATATITVNPLPSALSITPSTSTICSGSIQSLVSSGGAFGSTSAIAPTSPVAQGGSISATAFAIGTYYQSFDVLQAATLVSIDVYPTAAVGTAGSVSIANSSGTILATATYTVTNSNGTTPHTVTFNYPLTVGTGYRIGQGGTAINLNRNTTNQTYPVSNSLISITGNNFNQAYWYYIYNWQLSTLTQQPITWSPTTALYTDAAATVAYTGAAAATVYAKPTSNITYTATATATTGCTSSNTVAITVNQPTLTWTGATSTDPTVSTNWNPVALPCPVADITVPGGLTNYPIYTSNLTISSGGSYTLQAGAQLTVNGTLTNNGTFTLQDGATFVQGTSGTSIAGTGTYNVQKALTDNSTTWSTTSGRFWYMGVPMVNVARSSYGAPDVNANRLWSYTESSKSYTELSDGTALLSAGTGYVHRRSTDGTLTFTATGANGLYGSNYTASGLTKTAGYTSGVNLVSNPYMAYLDWVAVIGASPTIDPTFYIRSNNVAGGDISALISYNANNPTLFTNTSSVNITNASQIRYIAPMQSVWVKVASTASSGTINMNRGMLSHQTGNGLKSNTVFPALAKVNLVDGNRFDQMLVFMNSDMSNEVDQYDSEKLPVSGTVQLYTMASNKKLVMNGLKNNKKKVSVPLYLELPASKSYTLNLADYVLDNGLILLEDKQEGTMQDFTLLGSYTFYANSGLLQNRFVLHFILPDAEFTTQGPSNSWVGPETSYTEGGNVQITNDDRGNIQITVDQPEEQKVEGNVSVTDMNGKEVYRGQLDGITTAVELNVPAGIYYLTVQSGALFEKKKVFIQD